MSTEAAMNHQAYGVEFHGPFVEEYRVTVRGYRVPRLTAILLAGTEDRWLLTLDERFMIEAEGDEVRRWVCFVANAMAIGAGYSCHGAMSRPINPYAVQMSGLATNEGEINGE